MYIKSDFSDFSQLGLGKVVTEVDEDVLSMLEGFDNLDFGYKLKFQSFINEIGGIEGDIFQSITKLYVPYFAGTVDEAYYDLKRKQVVNPGVSSDKAGCYPTRGSGATYDQTTYNNCLGFSNIYPAGSHFVGICINIKNNMASFAEILADNNSKLGKFVKPTDKSYIDRINGCNINNQGYGMTFDKQIPFVGNHSFLIGLDDDSNITKESFVAILDNTIADNSGLPNGTYTTSMLPWYNNTTFKYNNGNIDYTNCKYYMIIAGGDLSKQELITLNKAMYNFCKYI